MLGVLLLGGALAAPPVSSVDIQEDGFEITLAPDEFGDRLPLALVQPGDELLVALTVDATWISVDGAACRVGTSEVQRLEDGTATIYSPILCNNGQDWRYHATWLRGRHEDHRHVVSAFGEPVGVLTPEHTSITLLPGQIPTGAVEGSPFSRLGLATLLLAGGILLLFLLAPLVILWVARRG